MNAPYSFNFKYDPILENPFRSEIDYNKEIDERVRQLQLMKDKYNSTVKQTIQFESLWNKIDNEIKSLNDDQRNILFSDKNYISIDTQHDMIDNLIISPVKEERGIKIGAGTVEIKIPFINKAIALDKDDINEFKEMLSKIQQ